VSLLRQGGVEMEVAVAADAGVSSFLYLLFYSLNPLNHIHTQDNESVSFNAAFHKIFAVYVIKVLTLLSLQHH
jgi:hypothetical protein